MRGSLSRIALLAAAGTLLSGAANAASLDITGFVRFEPSIKITDDENPQNQYGFNTNGQTDTLNSTFAGGGVGPTIIPSAPDGKISADNEFNMFAGRAEVDFTVNVSEQVTLFAKVRAFGQPNVFDEFGDPDFFGTPLWGNDRGTLLEFNGDNYMVDIPAMYIDYNNGPLWIRAGNQQIAWGESLFFRVLDVPNGLDLRRHLVLDVGAEEFSDKRVPAPGVRGSYRITEGIEAEAFVQLFNPTILPNVNTPYNVVNDAFNLDERYFDDDDKYAATYGGRVQAAFGDLSLQAMAVSRRNPDGVVTFADSNDTAFGGLLDDVPFISDPGGVQSASEFLEGAALYRLNVVNLGNEIVRRFPKAGALGVPISPFLPLAVANSITQTKHVFDSFFQGLGPLAGVISRQYKRETILGVGANYLVRSDNEYLDQLVLRTEASITPNKQFTKDLSPNYAEEDEIAAALVAEKYHRFSQAFPATFFVTQYLFKSDSDIFGRHLSGMGGTEFMTPTGVDNSHYFVFAFQQPFPSLIWRADFAVLYDVQGGAQIQPGLKWKPREQYTVELYANILESNGGNDDFAQTIDFADEIFLRLGYQF